MNYRIEQLRQNWQVVAEYSNDLMAIRQCKQDAAAYPDTSWRVRRNDGLLVLDIPSRADAAQGY